MLDDFSLLAQINELGHCDRKEMLTEMCLKFIDHKIFKSIDLENFSDYFKYNNKINADCLNDNNYDKYKGNYDYFRDVDEAKTSYYKIDTSHASDLDYPNDKEKEAGYEIYVDFAGKGCKKLSIFSDIVKAIAPAREELINTKPNSINGDRTNVSPYEERVKKIRICFDKDVFDKSKIRKLISGG
jgi:hypothetical protein